MLFFLLGNNACAMIISDFHLAVIPYKYQPPLKPLSHARLTMKALNCFYLLSLLTLSLYATAMGGTGVFLDKGGWQPIRDVKDPFIQTLGWISVTQHNKRTGPPLSFVEVFKADIRKDKGTYYRVDLTAKDRLVPKKYQAIILELEEGLDLMSFTPLGR